MLILCLDQGPAEGPSLPPLQILPPPATKKNLQDNSSLAFDLTNITSS